MKPQIDCIPYPEALAIIALPKLIAGDVEWNTEPEGSELFTAHFVILDEEQKSIPGLTVELLYRRGLVKGECKCLFTVFSNKTKKLRALQIEVIPANKSGHTEDGVKWFGPHRHTGCKNEKVPDLGLKCDDHKKWFQYFLNEANIRHIGNYLPPDPPDPQLDLGI